MRSRCRIKVGIEKIENLERRRSHTELEKRRGDVDEGNLGQWVARRYALRRRETGEVRGSERRRVRHKLAWWSEGS